MHIYPFITEPVFKQYIWGGNALKTKFGKNIPDDFASESWEVSCHVDGPSKIKNGKYAGKLLWDVLKEDKKAFLGNSLSDTDDFPLLLKLLDANDNLSVQVHPDDKLALELEGVPYGKTEMWYIIDAKPDAKLVYGLKEGSTPDIIRSAIENGTLEEHLNYVSVRKGDSFFIPAGTVHAVGKGLLIAEIQQSSNTTYRMYDYNRRDKDGNLRELHIEKAIKASEFNAPNKLKELKKEIIGDVVINTLSSCEFFTVKKYEIANSIKVDFSKDRFEMLICTEGEFDIIYDNESIHIKAGDSVFIPAILGSYEIRGQGDILRSFTGGE